MRRSSRAWVQVSVWIVGESRSGMAFRLRRIIDAEEAMEAPEWVPKSQIRDPELYQVGVRDLMLVSQWFADKAFW